MFANNDVTMQWLPFSEKFVHKANGIMECEGVKKEVTSLWFVRVGRVIHAQTMMPCAAFECNDKSSNQCVEGNGRIHSFHYCLRSSGFIEEVADQTGLELFSMPR